MQGAPRRPGNPPPPPPYMNRPGNTGNPQLFEDTSYVGSHPGYNVQQPQQGPWSGYGPGQNFPGQQILADPMAAMAVQYGQVLADQGKEMVHQKLEKYVSVSKLKYYFAVDTAYVAKKLALLFFPFSHTEWSVQYNQNEPVPPRYDVNAPDLYIPSMAFVTYVLLSGYLLGLKNKFTPEQLGMQASSAMMWLTVEILVILLAIYIMNINSSMRVFDVIAFSSYKFVSMIAALLASLGLSRIGYLAALIYSCISLDFFLLRTLRIAILAAPSSDHYGSASRRGLYLLLGICLIQPVMVYWLTYQLIVPVEAAE